MKQEITCPNCNTVFQVDESAYIAILEQVRGKEFENELNRRIKEINDKFSLREDSIRLNTEKVFEDKLSQKTNEIGVLNNEITRLKGIIESHDSQVDAKLSNLEKIKSKELFDAINEKDKKIAELENKIDSLRNENKISLIKEKNAGELKLREKDKEITELKAELKAGKLSAENRESQLKEQHSLQLRDKQEEIDRLKDFRLKLSTKMVGETLEQHCSIQFSQAQSMGLYPDALFCKDNNAVDHTKGDFIFRDFIDGSEYISVMFEMKNEMDTTVSKHKNEDFLEKLDRDRKNKGCEYAVLVSMLEQGNELYDSGIVDKSHRYPKMIVIRPQFFIPVLRLITEAAKKGFKDRMNLISELESARNQTRDFANFEKKLDNFRNSFNKNVEAAHKKFTAATEGIDKTIEALEKQIKALRDIKANFEASEQKLLRANEIADEDLTVKKLTHGSPIVRKMIEDAAE